MSDPDLTCPKCEGVDSPPFCFGGCKGAGRRPPTLREWDALVSERDQLLRERDAAHDARIEVQNPGIDIDEVRRLRLGIRAYHDRAGKR